MTQKRSNIVPIDPPRDPRADNALKYDDEYCQRIRDYAQAGMFPEEWCAHIGVAMSTFYRWANEHPKFAEAVHIAWHILSAYWSDYARKNLLNPNLRTTLLIEMLRKRFPDTWGKNARNTHENFENRWGKPDDEGDEVGASSAEDLKKLDRGQLEDKIRRLEARRQHQKEE